ncbi:response regulator [Candidatus Uhrbacteria bacterium]|nr:response regulator [Candidatus Uhrbacteria bacterium]
MILAIVDDMIFRGKVEEAAKQMGTPLTIAADAEAALRPGQGWSRVLIDLNLSGGDVVAMIRRLREAHPDVPVVGYCSHVQQNLKTQALEAGCTTVLPRSAFVQQLPELLSVETPPNIPE